jgi:hypothetical protein
MDPNETLREIRELVRPGAEAQDPDGARLSELVQALDEWLSKGGFAPAEWGDSIAPWSHTAAGRRWPDLGRRYNVEPLGGPHPGVNGSHLPEEDR